MLGVDRLVDGVTGRPRATIAVLLVVMVLVGGGAAAVDETAEMEMFDDDPPEVEAQTTISERFGDGDSTTTSLNVIVTNEETSVLDRESLLESLRFQEALLTDEAIGETLADDPFDGIANLVATAALHDRGVVDPDEDPSVATQRGALEEMTDDEVDAIVSDLLDGDHPAGADALALLPDDYDVGTLDADARLLVVTQETDGLVRTAPELSDGVREAQLDAADRADELDRDTYRLVGYGLMVDEEEAATTDSFVLVGPFALLFVIAALGLAYRDVVDVVLGLVGVGLVLLWTFGAMGHLGIDVSILLLATPVLLIGLSIDYCIHVVMRHREAQPTPRNDPSSATAMRESLGGLGPALVLVTLTAMIGFLSVRASGVPALGEFGVATAVGILGALVVFGGVVPALTVLIDRALARRGITRSQRALGTAGRTRRLLAGIVRVSLARPWTIIAVVVLLTSAGIVGGLHLEAEFASEDYMPEEAPEWTETLPAALTPSDYEVRDSLDLLFDRFRSPDQQVHFLVEGDPGDPDTLAAAAELERQVATTSVTATDPTGAPAVDGPITRLHAVAAENETVAAALDQADTTDDGVPDTEVDAVLEALWAAAPAEAESVVHPADEGAGSLLVVAAVGGTTSATEVADEMDAIEATVDDADVTVTGELIVNELVQRQLSETLIEGLLAALVAILAVLAVAFRATRSSATLGVVTLVPVLLGLSWLLGGMYLLGLPISFATAMIGGIALGLGVDYAIHMSERFGHELERHGAIEPALEASVVGTGGALFGSAVTTAGGFGVLSLSLVPVMQQFGLVIAMAIAFAFVASVLALPSLLVVWARHLR